MVEQDDLSCAAAVSLAEVSVDPAFPVAVAECSGSRGDRQLVRYEVVVGDGIRGEVSEISESECAHRLGFRLIVYLETNVPRVTMPTGSRILLRDARVGGDASVEKVV